MSIFDDLEERLLQTYNLSPKESFEDMGLDEEERDKILYQVSGTGVSDLNVDYSDFRNHIFFGSAYAAANFALDRVIKDYPLDGELKEKNSWRKTNTGYESWFFDNFPKQQGYLSVASGTTDSPGSWVYVQDYEGKIGLTSGSVLSSFTVECVCKLNPTGSFDSDRIFPLVSIQDAGINSVILSLQSKSDGRKYIEGTIVSNGNSSFITASIHSVFSQSNHIAFTYDNQASMFSIYINGALEKTSSVSSLVTSSANFIKTEVGQLYLSGVYPRLYFTGEIDDVRVWNKARPEALIKRNYYRTIHANHSGGLKLYLKFNEPEEYGNKVIDYSGNGLHGFLTGNFSLSSNIKSGTLASWFVDDGDPIFALNNTRTDTFITTQRNSGSIYDDDNPSMIFNLVPGFFVEDDDTAYQQLFLLLTARHFDRLKLYIDHLSNITKTKVGKFNGPPASLIDVAAKHYGLDIGGIYTGADSLQNFFGEKVYSTGSMETSIANVSVMLKRNILGNMIHILKSKGTQESIKSALRAVGLDDSVVNISEYTDFSGGIQTTFSPKTVERKVLSFNTSSNVYIPASGTGLFINNEIYQVRALFNTASLYLTQTVMRLDDPTSPGWRIVAERSNPTSSFGKLRFIHPSFAPLNFTSSAEEIWNNNWVNLTVKYRYVQGTVSYFISSADRSGFHFTGSGDGLFNLFSHDGAEVVLGSSGTAYFDGHMQEYRQWHEKSTAATALDVDKYARWGQDWELLEVDDLINGYDLLHAHLKLNDYTGSVSGNGPIHNYAGNDVSCYFSGFVEDSSINFPGKYIDKFDVSHTYDLNVDNDKIRIRDGSEFSPNDQNFDIPFVSIDFSPVTSLNKEIMKWMGRSERFAELSADPLDQYKDENLKLNAVRSAFFRNRVNSKIDFASFANLVKWFDSNFVGLLSQLLPLDVASSISNYVIEPHILEYNKVKKFVGVNASGKSTNLEVNVSVKPSVTAESGHQLGLADPGRFGAFVSASAEVMKDVYLQYSSSSSGINHQNYTLRKVLDRVLQEDLDKNSPSGYGNGFYVKAITGSEYLYNTLNVNPYFNITGVYYLDSDAMYSHFMSSSHGNPMPALVGWSGSFNGYQDQRWLWFFTTQNQIIDMTEDQISFYDFGLKYGGMWGQLRSRNNKSINGIPLIPAGSTPKGGTHTAFIGEGSYKSRIAPVEYIETFNKEKLRTHILWPTVNSYDGVELSFQEGLPLVFASDRSSAKSFGEPIDIEGYKTLNFEVLGRVTSIGDDIKINSIKFNVKFQFFSRETPGETGFETVMSGSRETTNYKNTATPIVYTMEVTDILTANVPANFSLTFERSLPKQKYMRVYIEPVVTADTAVGSMFVVVKGILSGDGRDVDELRSE